nr:serine/threonine-protein kinase hsl1 [Quercus suber]
MGAAGPRKKAFCPCRPPRSLEGVSASRLSGCPWILLLLFSEVAGFCQRTHSALGHEALRLALALILLAITQPGERPVLRQTATVPFILCQVERSLSSLLAGCLDTSISTLRALRYLAPIQHPDTPSITIAAMAERYRQSHQARRRQPLSEIQNPSNTPPKQQQYVRSGKLAIPAVKHLPHNESLEPNGSLAVRSSQPSSPEHKRIAQITAEHERGSAEGSKRNSAISTTSTNASNRKRKTYIGHWQLGKTIGKGGCSRVRVVRHRFRDQYGAVKIITRSTAETTRAQSLANLIESTKGNLAITASGYRPIPYGLEREIAVMKLLEHPNIVRLYDVWENRNEL